MFYDGKWSAHICSKFNGEFEFARFLDRYKLAPLFFIGTLSVFRIYVFLCICSTPATYTKIIHTYIRHLLCIYFSPSKNKQTIAPHLHTNQWFYVKKTQKPSNSTSDPAEAFAPDQKMYFVNGKILCIDKYIGTNYYLHT